MDTPTIRTFKLRRGRVTPGQAAALERSPAENVNTVAVPSGAILEIGFGFGEATVELAALFPDIPVVAVDVHTPGIGHVLQQIEKRGLTNLIVAEGDARFLVSRLSKATLRGVRVFFPDPWPKKRHHKRRLVSEEFLLDLARIVEPGGFLHVATDWNDYAEWAHQNIAVSSAWVFGEHELAKDRPVTRFEKRAHIAGRNITDLVALKV